MGAVRLGAVRLGAVRLGAVRLGAVRLRAARLGAVRLCGAIVRCDSVRYDPTGTMLDMSGGVSFRRRQSPFLQIPH